MKNLSPPRDATLVKRSGLKAPPPRIRVTIVISLAVGLLLGVWSASSVSQAGVICINDQKMDTVICPPPDGELVVDRWGETVCGIGWCAVDAAGKVKCSKVPGGAAILDQYGQSLCVGGCMEASEALCHTLKLPRF